MITGHEHLTRLESILAKGTSDPRIALERKNAILRWLIDVSQYEQRKAEDLDAAALAALATLPSTPFVASSILRIVAHPNHEWIRDTPWRPRIIQYLDSAVAASFYAGSISSTSQSHEKVEFLAQSVQTTEKKLKASMGELTSLDRLSVHRQAVLSCLNGQQGRVLIRPCLPSTIDTSLKELYARAETYCLERDSDNSAEHYTAASREADHFRSTLDEIGLVYARTLAAMAAELRSLLGADFANNASALPAKLSIERDAKKYPLHITQRQLYFSFIVRNQGPGYANDVTLLVAGQEPLALTKEPVYVGRIGPHSQYRLDVPGELSAAADAVCVDVMADWRNFDGTTEEELFTLTLPGQSRDVPWDRLVALEPYSLEAVETEEDLVGRKELFQRLAAIVTAKNAGSVILHGQKRIGKTSIAKALRSRLQREDHVVVYLESGDYIAPLAEDTVARLGMTLCENITHSDPRFGNLVIPSFSDALSPLAPFLDQVCRLVSPINRVVIILDEFDQLPLELYDRTPVGDALFLTLRSLTSRPRVAFIVVGGERMTYIIDRQGQQLNKWNTIAIDYFDKSTDWTDYKELIQKPTEHTLEFADDALALIYEVSAGNPYFTNMMCQRLFAAALRNRDSHVTVREVINAMRGVTMNADRNTFQHFWDDGILETGEAAVERSTRRKKVLLATADVLSREQPAKAQSIKQEQLLKDVTGVDPELRDLAMRKVLVGKDSFEFKVPLFLEWLKDRGVHDIIATFDALDHYTRKRKEEAARQVGSGEIVELTASWGTYRGQQVTAERVRAWLNQFNGANEQRLAFTILRNLKFYSNALVREKLRELDTVVNRRTVSRSKTGRKRGDVLISYLDGVGKSGAQCAALYAEEAGVYVENVVERGRIAEKLIAKDEIQVLVFVDDLIGTGDSIDAYIKSLEPALVDLIKRRRVPVVIAAVAACVGGRRVLEERAGAWPFAASVYVGDTLDESFRCFSDESSAFQDAADRQAAKDMALRYGRPLEKKCPLGYGDLELAVVFERMCPNNSLPILWSRSSRWTPLFPRE